ncbi:hypothetical protein F5Y16DRAFT_385939 [Xylariaceae sp. FL0255]|nr:hypothetical protein F5Y16DRAFT_385939 [Xylariaceae sp. FL0255]
MTSPNLLCVFPTANFFLLQLQLTRCNYLPEKLPNQVSNHHLYNPWHKINKIATRRPHSTMRIDERKLHRDATLITPDICIRKLS